MCEPTDADLQRIREWNWRDVSGWFDLVKTLWNYNYGHISTAENAIVLVTGGWSDHEVIISAMQDNTVLWMRAWYSSTRGGRHEFRLPAA